MKSIADIGGRPVLRPWLVGFLLVGACGMAAAIFPPLSLLLIGILVTVLASRHVERLAVISFWTLPYMVANIPTGAFTLKLPELIAYLFAAAFVLRSLVRGDHIELPPATTPVLIYLAIMCLATAVSPVVPPAFQGTVSAVDRNSPAFRSTSIILWLALCWCTVIAAYNVIGRSPVLFRRCLRAHILGAGIACGVSLAIYLFTLAGIEVWNVAGLGIARNLAPQAGNVFRLAGVAYEPLFLAFYLVTVIPVTIAALLHFPRLISRPAAAVCLALEGLAMLLTFSTGGYVAILAALVLLWPVVKSSRLSPRVLGSLGAAALLLSIAAAAFLARQQDSLGSFAVVAEKLAVGGDEIRRAENIAGWRIFEDHPLLGVGPGMAGYHFPRYHPYLQSQILSGGVPEVNSLYLAALAETGVAGLAALLYCGLAGIAGLLRSVAPKSIETRPGAVPWAPDDADLRIDRNGREATIAFWALLASLGGCAVHYLGLNPLFLIYFTGLLSLAVSAARLIETERWSLTYER